MMMTRRIMARPAAGLARGFAALILILAFASSAAAQEVRTHVVRPGETLYRIATTYGLSVTELKRLNGLSSNTIRAGQRLVLDGTAPAAPGSQPPVVPVAPATQQPATQQPATQQPATQQPATQPPAPAKPAAQPPTSGVPGAPPVTSGEPSTPPAILTPSPRESVFDVAFRFGITPDTLFALNPDLPVSFGGAAVLRVPETLVMQTYRVRRGDTLYRIATSHGTTAAAIRAANGMVSDQVNIGQDLLIPGQTGTGSGRTRARGTAAAGLPPVSEQGTAAVYPSRFAGRLMSGGDPYDPARFTVAHPGLALGTVLLITNTANGRATFAEVADRMPGGTGRILEVSAAVAGAISLTDRPVSVRIIDLPR